MAHQVRDCTEESGALRRDSRPGRRDRRLRQRHRFAARKRLENDHAISMISTAAGRPGNTAASGGIVRWFGRGAYALAAYWERRAAIRALLQRNDRELRDIGLLRSEIELAVRGEFSPDMRRVRQAR